MNSFKFALIALGLFQVETSLALNSLNRQVLLNEGFIRPVAVVRIPASVTTTTTTLKKPVVTTTTTLKPVVVTTTTLKPAPVTTTTLKPVAVAPKPTPAPAAVGPCQSATLCVHAKMPLLSQRDSSVKTSGSVAIEFNKTALGFDSSLYSMGLLQYVNKMAGVNLHQNGGWCGGVSSAMLIKAFAEEKNISSSAMNLKDKNVNSFIYNAMRLVGTKIGKYVTKNGKLVLTDAGTSNDGVKKGFRKIASRSDTYSGMGNVSTYRSKNAYVYLNLDNEHAVAVNGTDGQYYIVYDPHGRAFSAKVSSNKLQWVKTQAGSQNPYYYNKLMPIAKAIELSN